MKAKEIAKLVNELCVKLEADGARRDFLVQYLGHFRALIQYLESLPTGSDITNTGIDSQKIELHWIIPTATITVTVNEHPF